MLTLTLKSQFCQLNKPVHLLSGCRLQDLPKTMTTAKIDHVSVSTRANVYFDGKCVSHNITLADGSKKSVGVVLPSTLIFNTSEPEIMECVGGGCEYKLAGSDFWVVSGEGEQFSVPGQSSFEIRVAQSYHYICHFG